MILKLEMRFSKGKSKIWGSVLSKFLGFPLRRAIFSAMSSSVRNSISVFFQGLLFSLINSISAPGQIPGGKRRADTQIFFSISDGLIGTKSYPTADRRVNFVPGRRPVGKFCTQISEVGQKFYHISEV